MNEVRYGNSVKLLKIASIAGGIIGSIVAVIAFISIYTSGEIVLSRIWFLFLLPIVPAAALSLIVGWGILFNIVIRDDKIEHVLMGRYILSSYPLASLKKVKTQAGIYALILYFKQGKIRIFSMYLGEVQRLLNDLKELSKDG